VSLRTATIAHAVQFAKAILEAANLRTVGRASIISDSYALTASGGAIFSAIPA
jgi:hypothetical protein